MDVNHRAEVARQGSWVARADPTLVPCGPRPGRATWHIHEAAIMGSPCPSMSMGHGVDAVAVSMGVGVGVHMGRVNGAHGVDRFDGMGWDGMSKGAAPPWKTTGGQRTNRHGIPSHPFQTIPRLAGLPIFCRQSPPPPPKSVGPPRARA